MRTWHRFAPQYVGDWRTGFRRVWECRWCGLVVLELPPVNERAGCPHDPLAVAS